MTKSPTDTATLVEQFSQALTAVGGTCTVVSDANAAARRILSLLSKPSRIGASNGAIAREVLTYIPQSHTCASEGDPFAFDVGITGVQWGIAETGTLVLDSSNERNRLLSLIPPIHVALLQRRDLRSTAAAVFAEAHQRLGSALTFITGPSRTSDIELIPVIGVHGPQQLHVIILP